MGIPVVETLVWFECSQKCLFWTVVSRPLDLLLYSDAFIQVSLRCMFSVHWQSNPWLSCFTCWKRKSSESEEVSGYDGVGRNHQACVSTAEITVRSHDAEKWKSPSLKADKVQQKVSVDAARLTLWFDACVQGVKTDFDVHMKMNLLTGFVMRIIYNLCKQKIKGKFSQKWKSLALMLFRTCMSFSSVERKEDILKSVDNETADASLTLTTFFNIPSFSLIWWNSHGFGTSGSKWV